MCRSIEPHGFSSNSEGLKIRSFFVRLVGSGPQRPIPESLTVIYLPRTGGAELEVDGRRLRPESPAYVTLHRVEAGEEAVYGTVAGIRLGSGVRFEVYVREDRVLEGVFVEKGKELWRMDCKCGLKRETDDVAAVEAYVAIEGQVALCQRVEMKVVRKRRGRRGFKVLEGIPEDREVDSDVSRPNCSGDGETMDGGDLKEMCEMEMEGVSWAVDLGIWVMCLGVGYFASKASARSLRRLRIL